MSAMTLVDFVSTLLAGFFAGITCCFVFAVVHELRTK